MNETSTPKPAPRRPLTELCHQAEEMPSPVVGRILPEAGKGQAVEVAAFNSSI